MSKKKVKQRAGLAVLNLVFIILCFVGLVPILYALSLSLSSSAGALSSRLSLLPEGFTLDNYRNILVEEPFLRWGWECVVCHLPPV